MHPPRLRIRALNLSSSPHNPSRNRTCPQSYLRQPNINSKGHVQPSSSTQSYSCQRCFSTSIRHQAAHDPNNDGRPNENSNVSRDEHGEDRPSQGLAEGGIGGRRSRGQLSSSSRVRQANRRNKSDLPPVDLPQYYWEQNVFDHVSKILDNDSLPFAMRQDLMYDKFSPQLVHPKTAEEKLKMEKYMNYFEICLERIQQGVKDIQSELAQDLNSSDAPSTQLQRSIELASRSNILADWFHEAAIHLAYACAPETSETRRYSSRPFWWWHVYKSFNQRSSDDSITALREMFDAAPELAKPSHHSLAQAIGDLPRTAIASLREHVCSSLAAEPPKAWKDNQQWSRPVTVLTTTGYGGKAISEYVGMYLAATTQSRLVRLNAYDVSTLFGDYLGQNWAYGRQSLSMLGFTCAGINGRLPIKVEQPTDEEYEDDDSNFLSTRGSRGGSLIEKLRMVQLRATDSFSKWETLKIDNVLEAIISCTSPEWSEADRLHHSQTSVIIQIDDWVELNLTIEGQIILKRLRIAVDNAWVQHGRRIAIVGTSSCETPSEEYQNAIEQLGLQDNVMARSLSFNTMETNPGLSVWLPKTTAPHSIQNADYFDENVKNVNRMIKALNPQASGPELLDVDSLFLHCRDMLPPPSPGHDLRASILPVPEVFAIAQIHSQPVTQGAVPNQKSTIEQYYLPGPYLKRPQDATSAQASQHPPLNNTAGAATQDPPSTPDFRHQPPPPPHQDDEHLDSRFPMRLNEYERRIASGQIDRDKLKVTFNDVHVPKETVSALRTLTSLALIRPEAFSYGVLAQDKIPGCLLYGPPGTGKTMLAKAVAKESGANMLEISGATINDKWVGESEKLVKAVFTLAKKLSPCVVFLDEADSLLANRSMFSNRASHREHLNQFLKEWDGMDEMSAFIMVATNRPFDLDDAILRRLPRKLLVDLPTIADRAAILRLQLRDEQVDPAVSFTELAQRTPYYSGSDLKNVCVAAAMAAVEEENALAAEHSGAEPYVYPEKRTLQAKHFESALRQIPASISEDMASLKEIKKFDEEYGNRRRKGKKRGMGFGAMAEHKRSGDLRIRDEA